MKDHFNIIIDQGIVTEIELEEIVLNGLARKGFEQAEIEVLLADTFDPTKE